MKYIVFWVLAKLVSVPCSEPTPNEYGITSQYLTAAFCQVTERDTLQKEFDSRAAAQAFIEGSKKHQCDWWPRDGIEKIWLDSASVEPGNHDTTSYEGATISVDLDIREWRRLNPHIVTAELRPDFEPSLIYTFPKRMSPESYSARDSIAALQKQVAELRAVVEKLAIKPGASPNKNEHGKQ